MLALNDEHNVTLGNAGACEAVVSCLAALGHADVNVARNVVFRIPSMDVLGIVIKERLTVVRCRDVLRLPLSVEMTKTPLGCQSFMLRRWLKIAWTTSTRDKR